MENKARKLNVMAKVKQKRMVELGFKPTSLPGVLTWTNLPFFVLKVIYFVSQILGILLLRRSRVIKIIKQMFESLNECRFSFEGYPNMNSDFSLLWKYLI